MKSTLCLLMALVCNVAWAQIEVSTSVEVPENTYSLLSKSGAYMSVGTGATQYRLGRFAFYAAEGENAYKIYSVDAQKWVSYTKANSYGGGANKATLVDNQSDAQAWKVVANGNYYNIAPLKNDGTLGGQYWNFHGGAGQVGIDIVGADAGGVDLFKVVDAHAQVHIAHAFDGQADAVFAGIEDAVLAGAVILEQQQAVAIGQLVNILGFAGVKQFLFHKYISLQK